MPDRGKIFAALRNCLAEPKCGDCPWEDCERFDHETTTVPVTLLLDVLELLREQSQVKPKKVNRYIDFDGEGCPYNPETYDCGACNAEITPEMLYCPRCGRGIKWNA